MLRDVGFAISKPLLFVWVQIFRVRSAHLSAALTPTEDACRDPAGTEGKGVGEVEVEVSLLPKSVWVGQFWDLSQSSDSLCCLICTWASGRSPSKWLLTHKRNKGKGRQALIFRLSGETFFLFTPLEESLYEILNRKLLFVSEDLFRGLERCGKFSSLIKFSRSQGGPTHLKDLYTRFLDVAMLFGADFVHVSAWYLNLKKIKKKNLCGAVIFISWLQSCVSLCQKRARD